MDTDMEDYKELINKLRYFRSCPEDVAEAANAIETLLTERDAAIEMLHGECYACKYKSGWFSKGPCATCKNGDPYTFLPHENAMHNKDNWEWSGPNA